MESITNVWLGGASGGTEVIAARSWRIGQRYYICRVRLYTELLYAIVPTLLCLLLICYHIITFLMFMHTGYNLVTYKHVTRLSQLSEGCYCNIIGRSSTIEPQSPHVCDTSQAIAHHLLRLRLYQQDLTELD